VLGSGARILIVHWRFGAAAVRTRRSTGRGGDARPAAARSHGMRQHRASRSEQSDLVCGPRIVAFARVGGIPLMMRTIRAPAGWLAEQ